MPLTAYCRVRPRELNQDGRASATCIVARDLVQSASPRPTVDVTLGQTLWSDGDMTYSEKQ